MEVDIVSKTGSSFTLEYQTYGHFQGIIENYVLDVYMTHKYRKGDVVIDLGAGIGDFSILATSAVGENGKVLAIEPSSRNFSLLKKNLLKNSIKNVIAYNYAVSDGSKMITIQYEDEKYEAQGLPIEQILQEANIEHPNIFKMDIEGAELNVVSTALATLKQCYMIPIELHDTKELIDKILLPIGFRYISFDQGRMRKNLLSYSLRHPLSMQKLYHKYKLLGGKRSIATLYQGTEITNIGKVVTGVYHKN